MADLKDTLKGELDKLIHTRDGCRAKMVQLKDAVEVYDKQINRLTHFLADFDLPDVMVDEPAKTKGHAKSPNAGKHSGMWQAVRTIIEAYSPEYVTVSTIFKELEEMKIPCNDSSIRNAVHNLINKGEIESTYNETINRRVYRKKEVQNAN